MSGRNDPVRSTGMKVLVSCFMSSFMLVMVSNYASYSYTDLAHVSPAMMATCMSIVNAIAVVTSVLSGAMITKSRSRLGKYRPWYLGSVLVCLVGGFLIFFNIGDSILLKAVVISIGYLLANGSMDFVTTSRNGLFATLGGTDSNARNLMMARGWQGSNLSKIVAGFAVVPLVKYFGRSSETLWFLIIQSIFTVVVVFGAVMMFRISKDSDCADEATEEKAKIKVSEMLKAVAMNREALLVTLCDVFRFTGFFVFMSMMVYQCTAVIGDMMAMTYVMSFTNIGAVIGNTVAPMITGKIGGRKRVIAVGGFLCSASFASIGLFGATTWGFTISASLAFFFMSFVDTYDAMLYIDAGEIWLHKTGKDTKPLLLSMYGIATKIAMTASSAVLGIVLTAISYQADVILDAGGKSMLTWATALVPAIGYFAPLLLMLLHRVSDKEMVTIIKENAEKF